MSKTVKIKIKHLGSLLKNGVRPSINSSTGLVEITDFYRKNGDGFELKFSDNTTIKCAEFHLFLKKEAWVYAKDINVGDVLGGKVVIEKKEIATQEWYDFTVDAYHESYIHKGIVHHNSGKSAIIYCYIRFMLERGERILLAVPSTSLVTQMYSDFEDYSSANGWDVAANVHQLYSGKEKTFDKSVLFCTWQSIHAMSKQKTKAVNDFYASWTVYIGDEAHRFASASLMQISNRLVNAKYRLGTTGTLNDAKVSKLNLEGSFGAVYRVITTKQLMDAGQVVKLKIKCLLLDYPEHIKKLLKDVEYQKEMDYITQCKQRNDFIVNLAKATKGNTLILFNFVEKHGKPLFKLLQEKCPDRPLFYISGEVATEERERIRKVLSEHSDAIITASYATLSTGVNIPSIENVIFASPGKSKIRNLQSIGRGLRLKEGKTSCNLFDIADNFALKSKLNTTMRHFRERIETYQEEQFEFTIKQIAMNI